MDVVEAASHRRSMRSLPVLTSGVVVVGAQSFLLAPLLPDIAAGLGTGTAEVGRALAAYGAGIVAAALLLATRLDRVPRRAALVAGALVLAAGAAGSAAAPTWELLALAQLVAGAGVGVLLPVTYALVAETAPAGTAVRATGRVLAGWSIALVVFVPLAAVLGDAVGWRGAFGALAALAAGQAVLYRSLLASTLPRLPVPATAPVRLAAALRTPGTLRLLAAITAFMVAFYGVFAFMGVAVRELHGGGASTAGLVALAYGAGFGLSTLADRHLERAGPAPLLAALAAVYVLLGAVAGNLPALLAVAVVWGLVNHAGLTLLMGRLAAPVSDARGAVLALNSAATYTGAAVAGAVAGPVYGAAGFAGLALAAALVVGVTVPVVARKRLASAVTMTG